MKINTIGWDIGGAHLKAVCINCDAEIIAVYQEPCSLWKGLDRLERALAIILEKLPDCTSHSVITMTGELVDLFTDRAEGVIDIINVTQKVLAQHTLKVYAGRFGFIQELPQ